MQVGHLVTRGSVIRHPWLIAIEEVRNNRKIVCIKNIFENGWWEDAYPSPYPSEFAPGHQNNLACFSHLAPLALFFFTKKQSQRGHDTMAPLQIRS